MFKYNDVFINNINEYEFINNNIDEYDFINYNIDLDKSLKETRSWTDSFRKSWNISIIILLTALVYIYYIFKKDTGKTSKF